VKKLLLAVSALALSAASASAADLAARPYVKAPMAPMIYDWSGFYIGVNGGWANSHETWYQEGDFAPPTFNLGSHESSGGVVGGQLGWRTQAGAFVWGFDMQGDWANLTGSNVSNWNNSFTLSTKTQAIAAFAVTAGWAMNNVLFYGKAGAMMTNNVFSASTGGVLWNQSNEQRWGGMLGAGLEYGFTPNWSFAVEYDHGFMGAVNDAFNPVNGPGVTNRVYQDIDMITGRINYRFGGPVVARY
jgi:outer membrane immunogenic protein